METIFGVDIGTGSVKVVAMSSDGVIRAGTRVAYALYQEVPGAAEQDPEEIATAVFRAISLCCQDLPSGYTVSALSLSSAMHGIMAVDASGRPLTRLLTWADTRSHQQAQALKELVASQHWQANLGIPVHAMLPAAKIRWMNEHLPGLKEKAHMYIGCKEYIIRKLTGEYILDTALAGATGLFDSLNLTWFEPLLAWAGINVEQLPKVVYGTERVACRDTQINLIPGLPYPLDIIVGSSDGCMANLGSGVWAEHQTAITVGTSGAVRKTIATYQPDSTGKTFSFMVAPGWYVNGGPINNGGILLKWFSEKILGRPFREGSDFTWFLQELSEIRPGAEGLTFLPYLLGERAPIWTTEASGVFYGLRSQHGKAHMMRALVESINFALLQIFRILQGASQPQNAVLVASGGFTSSREWMQMLSNIFNLPVAVPAMEDASAMGAAWLGWKARGETPAMPGLDTPSRNLYLPDPMQVAAYREPIARFDRVASALTPLFESENSQ